MPEDFQLLLYYLYTPIPDPEAYAARHRELCEELGLRGRILIAAECIGDARYFIKKARDYACERSIFGGPSASPSGPVMLAQSGLISPSIFSAMFVPSKRSSS